MSGPDASWIWSLAADWRRQFETFEGICLCKRLDLDRVNFEGTIMMDQIVRRSHFQALKRCS